MPAIVMSTANNYQERFEKFSAWADHDDNARPAKECRDLLLQALRSSSITASSSPAAAAANPACCSSPPAARPIRILDAGCGSGRDLEAFAAAAASASIHCNKRQIEVHGFDACPGFVAQCHDKGLSHVVLADFLTYFDDESDAKKQQQQFDAIFSLAALFHVPREQLRNVLVSFHNHLISSQRTNGRGDGGSSGEGGYLLISLPHGNRNELGKDGRWMHYMPKRQQMQLLRDVGLEILVTRKISQYNGHDWIVTLCQKK